MSPQETQVLEGFLTQLVQARVGPKDPQAEALITEALAKQPDAAYLLIQRALLLDQALASAKMQISSLENELQYLRQSNTRSFLDPASTWGNSAASRPVERPIDAPSMAAPAQPLPAQANSASRPGLLSGWGGTLGNIASTAAGVAGGALLFQGIENLFHHHNGNGFLSQSGNFIPSETTVINNYFKREDTQDSFGSKAMNNDFLDAGLNDSDFFDDGSSVI